MHALLGCIQCHGGEAGELTKEEAHVGMRADPSFGDDNSCLENCHGDDVPYYNNSIHATQAGYIRLFEERSGLDFESHPQAMAGFEMDCAGCHASCGDCHISSPKPVGGGLVASHKISKRPSLNLNCTACHGSRVGDEYKGANEYAGADVHWVPNRMHCIDCHSGEEMHGDATTPQHRMEVATMPTCDQSGCHDGLEDANDWHSVHIGEMSCNVCHSQDYKSCNGCHVGEGITGSSYRTFKIGRNPIPELREEDFVLLRHIPIVEDTFTGWSVTELPNYDAEPSWKYAAPHNISRWTARTDTTGGLDCWEACHDTEDSADGFFLRASDLVGLPQAEQDANADLIVPDGDPFTW